LIHFYKREDIQIIELVDNKVHREFT